MRLLSEKGKWNKMLKGFLWLSEVNAWVKAHKRPRCKNPLNTLYLWIEAVRAPLGDFNRQARVNAVEAVKKPSYWILASASITKSIVTFSKYQLQKVVPAYYFPLLFSVPIQIRCINPALFETFKATQTTTVQSVDFIVNVIIHEFHIANW